MRKRNLRIDSLKAIRTLAEATRLDFRGEVFLGARAVAHYDRFDVAM